jgi:superfamily II DNA or RNA helicase/uncharacterized protein YeaC (DUF1315 family)
MNKTYRYYQQEADDAICEELSIHNKCIVKMFCGTGKSLLMRKCKIVKTQKLVVYVFPSLNLIDQFYTDYLFDFNKNNILKISSEIDSTTDSKKIKKFIDKKTNKIICITYQSFKTLIEVVGNSRIPLCIFDEAHHAVGEKSQPLIFHNDVCEKQIFFTATPTNANGIVMYDRQDIGAGVCGNLVYDYSYLKGCFEGYLNPFEIRIDMYTENTNRSIYESIARAILVSGNNRVLTFHSDVDIDRPTSVNKFVNQGLFIDVFDYVLTTEFPEKVGYYKNIKFIGLTASTPDRMKILKEEFDPSDNDEIYIISSCQVLSEGIDTKNANMCVFVDPKTSYVKILQNFGRVVRKQFGIDKPNSTILIPCWVDKTKYLDCQGDREKCDEVIRQDMSADGNFNGILNVLSALKQEDEDIYDLCLHYPDVFSYMEIESNLARQGYQILDCIGDGMLVENLEYVLDKELDYDLYEDCDSDEDMMMRIAEDHDICIEIHTDSLETPIEKYNGENSSGETIRLYKSYSEDEDETIYQPIVEISGKKRNKKDCVGPRRENRFNMNVHTNPDIKVLWNIYGDFTKDICSCILDCEVVKYDPMEAAIEIVERANKRVEKGLNLLPRRIHKKNQTTHELIQEHKDGVKLGNWKSALKGNSKGKCSDEVCSYLDEKLPNWRIEYDEKAMNDAIEIVERANERVEKGLKLLPRGINKKNQTTPELIQEHKDAQKINDWKNILKGTSKGNCSDEVCNYLDKNLQKWRSDFHEKEMEYAIEIVKRANARAEKGLRLLPRGTPNTKNQTTPELIQEYKDATKLGTWKQALKGTSKGNCSDEVCSYLDEKLPNWRTELDEKAIKDAIEIVERANERVEKGLKLLPRGRPNTKNQTTPELIQEYKDATKLGRWKQALKGKGSSKCSDEVCSYLDNNLQGWRTQIDLYEKSMNHAIEIVARANERVKNGLCLLPRGIPNKKNRTTSELIQENKDDAKLRYWKISLKGKGLGKCSDEVRDYLDSNLPGWRSETDFDQKAIHDAIEIVSRANERVKNGLNLLPRQIQNIKNRNTPELIQEDKDAVKLGCWKQSLKGKGGKCSDEVRIYLDSNLPNWRTELDEKAMESAIEIVGRAKQRLEKSLNLLPRFIDTKNRSRPELIQEHKDARKLGYWKESLKGTGSGKCSDEVRDYLDSNLPGWRNIEDSSETQSIASSSQQSESTTTTTSPKSKKSMKLKLSASSQTPKPESTEEKKVRVKSELSTLHQRYKTLNSQNLQNEFKENPELWNQYHEIAEENEKSFHEQDIPRNRIIQELDKINVKRTKSVVDMGCGKGQISQYFKDDSRFSFINYDHISSHDTIISCDISQMPLESDSIEMCILCLAMWGSNCNDYVKEAHRILESGGKLYIIEATRRWSEKDETGNIIQNQEGNKLKTLLEENGFQIIQKSIEKFSLFVCIKI